MSLIKSFFTISALTFLSRIFGFIRDILIAAMMGTGVFASVFLVAFKLPNFFRRLFAEGAFNAAFVPMFSSILASEGKERAKEFASKIFSILLFTLLIFIILMEIFMPYVMYGLAPGFVGDEQKFELAIYLSRITFPYLLFISLASLFAGILNSVGRFAAYAFAPIILNVCMISGLLFLAKYTQTPAHALSIAVAIGGAAQLLWLYINLRKSGMSFGFVRPKLDGQVRGFLRKMAPGIIGAGVMQINLWIDIVIATFIPSAIAYLYYADRVNQLPLSIIGIAMGTALLPMLSRQIKERKIAAAIGSQNRALEVVLFFSLPATLGIILLAEPIISVLFERGEFSAYDSMATSLGLIAYCVGLPAFVMVKVFSASFFARGDTITPVKIAIIALVTNLVLNISLVLLFQKMGILPHIGLALATSIASWLNLTLLAVALVNKKHFYFDKRFKSHVIKIIFAVIVMGLALFFSKQYFIEIIESEILRLISIIFLAIIVYLTAAHVLKIYEIKEFKKFLRKAK